MEENLANIDMAWYILNAKEGIEQELDKTTMDVIINFAMDFAVTAVTQKK